MLPLAITSFPVSRCFPLLLVMSSHGYLFFPPRGHEPLPTLRDRLNLHLSLWCRRFPVPRYAKRPDVALYAIGPLFLLPTPSSPHCTLKVSKHDSYLDSGDPEEFPCPSRRVSTKRDRQQTPSHASSGCFVGEYLICGGLLCDVPGPWLPTHRFTRYLDI